MYIYIYIYTYTYIYTYIIYILNLHSQYCQKKWVKNGGFKKTYH